VSMIFVHRRRPITRNPYRLKRLLLHRPDTHYRRWH
jgi:hypothetical protein